MVELLLGFGVVVCTLSTMICRSYPFLKLPDGCCRTPIMAALSFSKWRPLLPFNLLFTGRVLLPSTSFSPPRPDYFHFIYDVFDHLLSSCPLQEHILMSTTIIFSPSKNATCQPPLAFECAHISSPCVFVSLLGMWPL